jgi:hypothetical protein
MKYLLYALCIVAVSYMVMHNIYSMMLLKQINILGPKSTYDLVLKFNIIFPWLNTIYISIFAGIFLYFMKKKAEKKKKLEN